LSPRTEEGNRGYDDEGGGGGDEGGDSYVVVTNEDAINGTVDYDAYEDFNVTQVNRLNGSNHTSIRASWCSSFVSPSVVLSFISAGLSINYGLGISPYHARIVFHSKAAIVHSQRRFFLLACSTAKMAVNAQTTAQSVARVSP
jgi:hypothetical protein